MVESRAETTRLDAAGRPCDVLLFTALVLAWSRFSIPRERCPRALEAVGVQLGAHVFAADAKLALADYLFSPDQLPEASATPGN